MRRALNWLWNAIAAGVVFWLLTLGGSAAISAAAAAASGLSQPWVSIFALGVFVFAAGALVAVIRLGVALLPRRWQQALRGRGTPRSAALPQLPDFLLPVTPRQRLTDLIEEGERLSASIPSPADDPAHRLAQTMAGVDINYPARVYEWEARVWRLLSTPALRPLRGLYRHTGRAQRLHGLGRFLNDRLEELRTILARA